MNIGIIIGRIGGVDGVALETEKWIHVLLGMGHHVFLLSGEYERTVDVPHTAHLPLLSFFSKECIWEQEKAFYHPDKQLGTFLRTLETHADIVAAFIQEWVRKEHIDLVLSENASSLPAHLSMGWGIQKAASVLGLPIITHDHDFAWERGRRYQSVHPAINTMIAQTFPLHIPEARHAVINSNARAVLKEKFNTDAIIVPNVMDFDQPFVGTQRREEQFRKEMRLQPEDIILLQATRIVPRKGIETAIELINRMKESRLKLVVTGTSKDDHDGVYDKKLQQLIARYSLQKQIRFIGDSVRQCTSSIHNQSLCPEFEGRKQIYSLSEVYSFARACSYFSTYEGFGNGFIEAVVAKKPIFVNNYKPVFWPDIGSLGFKTVMLEENQLSDEAVTNMRTIIFDENVCKEIGEYNFFLGKKYFSYDTLRQKLTELVPSV